MPIDFTEPELTHYKRHFLLPEVGTEGQQRLNSSRVLYIGAGGLGSSALLYLAAAGVGTIGIVDDDCIEASNLHRQVLYSYDDIGNLKIDAAKQRLQKLNPHIQIELHPTALKHENALELIKQYDVIADGSDNFATRYIVNDACFHLNKPNVYASISRFEGFCSIFTAKQGPCYRCLFDTQPPPGMIPTCAEAGVLGVLPGILGSIQAAEVIKYILGIGKPLINRLLIFNALNMQFRELAVQPNPDCRLCQHQQSFDTLPDHNNQRCAMNMNQMSVTELKAIKNQVELIDVREQHEYDICQIGGKLIPLGTLANRMHEIDKNKHVVVHCRSGGRSQQAVQFLLANGFSQVSNLAGGILKWIDEVDPSLTKY